MPNAAQRKLAIQRTANPANATVEKNAATWITDRFNGHHSCSSSTATLQTWDNELPARARNVVVPTALPFSMNVTWPSSFDGPDTITSTSAAPSKPSCAVGEN